MRGADVACHREHLHQPRLAALAALRVDAGDVGGVVEPERQRGADLVAVEHPARECRVDRRGVERRDLDQVEAELGGAGDRVLAFAVAPAADPDERMDAELVHVSLR